MSFQIGLGPEGSKVRTRNRKVWEGRAEEQETGETFFPKGEAGQHRVNWILRWFCINKGQQSVSKFSTRAHTHREGGVPRLS